MTHPSFFALDAHVLDPQQGDVQTHLATCEQCQAHVASLKTQTPFPEKLAQLPLPTVAPWWRFLTLAFAAAAVIFAIIVFSNREQPQLITAKGTPTAALWINRAGKSALWNGEPIHAGDSIRIEVAPAGFTHVTVFDENTKQLLYEAKIGGDGPSLTPAWEFDGQATSESLRVVLSSGPAVLDAKCERSSQSFCTRFVLQRGE